MGELGSSSSSCFAGFVVVLYLVLNASVLCNGGKTSNFVRKVEKTIDMPLDSDVFRVPPGYNAPQQVLIVSTLSIVILCFLYVSLHSFVCFFRGISRCDFVFV